MHRRFNLYLEEDVSVIYSSLTKQQFSFIPNPADSYFTKWHIMLILATVVLFILGLILFFLRHSNDKTELAEIYEEIPSQRSLNLASYLHSMGLPLTHYSTLSESLNDTTFLDNLPKYETTFLDKQSKNRKKFLDAKSKNRKKFLKRLSKSRKKIFDRQSKNQSTFLDIQSKMERSSINDTTFLDYQSGNETTFLDNPSINDATFVNSQSINETTFMDESSKDKTTFLDKPPKTDTPSLMTLTSKKN
ncbi:hypothetical protein SNEBB_011466 [Seison nebaliae]|nr:hypothetical protein SNEBB_011466 [Seison nebaliae]